MTPNFVLNKNVLLAVFLMFISTSIAAESTAVKKLFDFHSEAAKQGDPQSMYILGNLYERGRGTKRDYNKAIKWYSKAAKLGNDRALTRIEEVLQKKKQLRDKPPASSMNIAPPTHTDKAKKELLKPPNSNIQQQLLETKILKEQLDEEKTAAAEARKEAEKAAALLQQQLDFMKLEAEKSRREAERVRRKELQIMQEKAKLKGLEQRLKQQEFARQAAPEPTKEKAPPPIVKEFKSDPCDSPSARFMSTCR